MVCGVDGDVHNDCYYYYVRLLVEGADYDHCVVNATYAACPIDDDGDVVHALGMIPSMKAVYESRNEPF